MAGEDWPVLPLGELTENFDVRRIPVKEIDRKPGPYPYYGASGIVDRIDGYLFDGEYLLIGEDGENLRTRQTPIAFIATGKFWVNNHAHVFRGNLRADTRFLNYVLSQTDVSGYLTGSTMPKLTQGNLSRLPVIAPPLLEQKAIAGILGSLDDKIELNRRMNATLERMARALFQSWFVDFDPVRAKQGGEPDCRNRTLHKMFRFVGVGEQAGTGIPKILHGWQLQHWSPPKLYDTPAPYNQTLLELRMIDLFPDEVIASLKARWGARFDRLAYLERVALALAASEGTVNHARLRAVTAEHPVDLSKTLQHLTQDGLLESTGGRGAVYHLPGEALPMPEDVFGPPPRISAPSSPNLASSSPNLTGKRDADGCLMTEQLHLPVIDDLAALSPRLRASLETMAIEPRSRRKVDREVLTQVLLRICAGRFVTLRCLAELAQRRPETLRDQYLTGLVRERKLALAFPTIPTHERQAYSSTLAPLA